MGVCHLCSVFYVVMLITGRRESKINNGPTVV